MKMMTGKDFEEIYSLQIGFQEEVTSKYQKHLISKTGVRYQLPFDNPLLFSYHVTSLQEEIGELLKADKRWKTHRNNDFNYNEKLSELSDCFIILLNIAIHSGYDSDELLNAVREKIDINLKRLDMER